MVTEAGGESNRLAAPLDEALSAVSGEWGRIVSEWRRTDRAEALVRFVDERVAQGIAVYPAHVLRALELTPFEEVRLVILGQDPYHGPGQAQGLAFSVPPGVRLPPSLRNIYKELERDMGVPFASCGDLEEWARQGVLLLNTSLTVEAGNAASHAGRGWEELTDRLIEAVAIDRRPKVFMLWGAHAQSKTVLIEGRGTQGDRHLILKSNHPSPLSARRGATPFSGSGHFRQASEFLARVGSGEPIDWRVKCG